eukprot:53013-Chlamydomonas_euryale.AAC.4
MRGSRGVGQLHGEACSGTAQPQRHPRASPDTHLNARVVLTSPFAPAVAHGSVCPISEACVTHALHAWRLAWHRWPGTAGPVLALVVVNGEQGTIPSVAHFQPRRLNSKWSAAPCIAHFQPRRLNSKRSAAPCIAHFQPRRLNRKRSAAPCIAHFQPRRLNSKRLAAPCIAHLQPRRLNSKRSAAPCIANFQPRTVDGKRWTTPRCCGWGSRPCMHDAARRPQM